MKITQRYLTMLLCCLLLASACRSSREDEDELPTAQLSIYVYAPDHPMNTRAAGTRGVDASKDENRINTLQIWVFEHESGARLGYLESKGEQLANLNSDLHSEVFRMDVKDADFIANPKAVDVYVAANVTADNCGLTFGERTYRDKGSPSLEGTLIGTDYFCPQFSIPTDGLPMSGFKRNVAVTGTDRVLHVSMEHLDLVRAVSRIRFVFSCASARSEQVDITNIELDKNLMPLAEYMFLKEEGGEYNSDTAYKNDTIKLLNKKIESIAKCDAVQEYKYQDGQSLDDYFYKINDGIEKKDLTEAPPIYLRETDKKLEGTIYYTVGTDATKRKVRFAMADDVKFYRNRTWIVYAYYSAGQMEASAVEVTPWKVLEPKNQNAYNW